jgi:ComF family protein
VRPEDAVYRETRARLIDPGPLTELAAMYYFVKDGVLQALLHQLKYQGMTRVGDALGRQLGAYLAARGMQEGRPVLVPVPLHRSKRRERGFNQSEWICRGIAAVTGLPIETQLLRRIRYTRSQTGLQIDQRRLNVDGAFDLHPSANRDLGGKSLLLVDDVVTTGSTLEACARVLVARGAGSVSAAAIAIAP